MSNKSSTDNPGVNSAAKFNPHHILLVLLCMSINMLDGFDITAMAVVASDLATEMSIGDDKLGFVFSFSLAGMMLGALFLAPLSDLYGRRTVILFSLSIVAASVFATAFANNLGMLIVLRFISGLGAGAMLASLAALVSEYTSSKYTALAVSVVTAGYPLGAMFTGIVAAYIVPDYGWRGMFIAGGIVTFVLCAVALALMPESLQFLIKKGRSTRDALVLKLASKYDLERVLNEPDTVQAATQTPAKTSTMLDNIKHLLSSDYRIKTITLWMSFLFIVCTLYFLLSWLPKLLINEGYEQAFSRQAFTAMNFGGVLGVMGLGALAARWSLSHIATLFLVVAAALMLAYSVFNTSNTAVLILVFLIGLSLQGGFTGLYALAAKLYKPDIRSTGVGWAIGLGRLGAVFGPAIAGILIASGVNLNTNFILFALPVILGGIGIYTLKIR